LLESRLEAAVWTLLARRGRVSRPALSVKESTPLRNASARRLSLLRLAGTVDAALTGIAALAASAAICGIREHVDALAAALVRVAAAATAPLKQEVEGPQAFVQEPQCDGFDDRSTQVPLQLAWPDWHVHLPDVQR
jgi:hypothetical protein